MTSFLFGILFAGITLLAIGLQRTYYHYPVKELKRRARGGDHIAELLYRPVSYGVSLKVLLWGIVTVSATLSLVLMARSVDTWFAFLLVGVFVWVGFLWLPSTSLTSFSLLLARWLSPLITRLVSFLYPLLQRIGSFFLRFRRIHVQTGLYEKDDLLNLLDRQRDLPDNRIPIEDIDLVSHALEYGDRVVGEVMVPLRAVTFINEGEPIGPKLMDELYQSGHSRFPVYRDTNTNIVGTLYLRDMVKKQVKGHVRDVMHDDVYYVHEDFYLAQVLQAFLKTKHHLFIVVNSFEEFVGIITIEDVLEQVIGRPIVDEFDKYDSMRAVAMAKAQKEHDEREHKHALPDGDDGQPDLEVIE